MNIKEIINSYLGNTQVKRIYQGVKMVWPIKYVGNRYLIGGNFTSYSLNDKSITKNKIIRLNNDDSIDNTWYNNSYTSGAFYELKYDNINKKVYAVGDPALDGGLVRYNLDGTKDTSFNIGTGFNARVRSIIIYNSKIYVGGEFTTYKGSTQNRLIRLNMNGSKDTSFNIGTGFNGSVLVINIDNNKLCVLGNFTTYNGSTQNRLVKLNMNGLLDTDFDVGTLFNANVRSMIIDNTNSKIYVGGEFTKYTNRIYRLDKYGGRDSTFNVGTGFNNTVFALNIDPINQKLYVSGNFTTYNGTGRNRLVRLNLNGSLDTSFNIGTGLNSYIEAPSGILVDNEKNKIYIAGNFTTYNGQPQKYIARLNMNGSLDTSFNIQLDSPAMTILKYTE